MGDITPGYHMLYMLFKTLKVGKITKVGNLDERREKH